MVKTLTFSKKDNTVDVRLSKNDVYDIINGLNRIYADIEEDYATRQEEYDKVQMERYKACRNAMQNVMSNLV